MDYQLHHHILVWMEEAASKLRLSLEGDLEVEEKTNARDLVTIMDKEIEAFFIRRIRRHYPSHRIIGEEGQGDSVSDSQGTIWVIDPIDGTLNYVKAKNHFGIMIGIFIDGEPVAGYIYDVMKENLYYGIVGDNVYLNDHPLDPIAITKLSESLIVGNVDNFSKNVYNMQALLDASLGGRALGSAAMELVSLIRGEVCLYFSVLLRPWDFAAGYAICKSMGYKVTTHKGEKPDILKKTPIIFAHPNVHEEALSLLNQED